MDSEKDFLKRDLGNAETKEEIETLIEDAETLGGHEDVVELARKKLEAVLAKAQSVETTPPAQVAQVETMGGSLDEVEKRTEGVDAQIDAVKTDTESRIAEVTGTVERPPVPPVPPRKIEEQTETIETTPVSEITEKKSEEIEQLNLELKTHLEKLREIHTQTLIVDSKIKAIENNKQYQPQIRGGEVVDVLASLIPNKNAGIENYKKIIAALPDDPYYRDRPKKVLSILEGMSDEQVKNMSSAFDFQNFGINAPRYDYVDYGDLAKVTGSEKVSNAINQFNRSNKEEQTIRDQIANNPDMVVALAEKEALVKELKSEEAEISNLESRIKSTK